MKKFVVGAIALAIVGMVAAPALADFNPYGSVRMETFYKNVTQPSDSAIDDDGDLVWQLEAISRFGAIMNTDDITGRVEFGFNSGGGNSVSLRQLWADYKTEAGTLRIGQWYTHSSLWLSDMAAETENGNIGYGATYDGREPMIRWTMPMGLSIELLQPETPSVDANAGDIDTFLPKIGLKYTFKADMVSVELAGAFQTYNQDKGTALADDETINSWFVGTKCQGSFGPATVTGTFSYGMNLGNHGISGGASALVDTDGKIEDSTQYGGWLAVAMAAGPGTATLGAGFQTEDNDLYKDADSMAAYFLQYNYPIAKTFFIVPEIAYFDEMDDSNGDEEADRLYVGAKWQMNF